MDWISKSRKLVKRLEVVKRPGKRLKLIREAKDRLGDSKGEYGFAKVATKLASMGAMKDDQGGRRVLKRFESGEIKIPHTKEPVASLIKLLGITPEFAGYSTEAEKAAPKVKRSGMTVKISTGPSSFDQPTSKKEYGVLIRNHIEGAGMTLQVHFYPEIKEIVIELFGDMPVPSPVRKKSTVKCRSGEIWVPGLSRKHTESTSPKNLVGEEHTKI